MDLHMLTVKNKGENKEMEAAYTNQLEKVVNAVRIWKETTLENEASYSELDFVSDRLREAIEDLDLFLESQKDN